MKPDESFFAGARATRPNPSASSAAPRPRTVAVLSGFFLPLAFAATAHADPSAADKSLATELFKQGRALMTNPAGPASIVEACQKLAESQRLDPGGGTLLNVALCHEQQGLTATAWAEFNEALGTARRDRRPDRIEMAEAHIAALEPKLSRLVVLVPDATPGLDVRRDGSPLGRAAFGTAMPVDPGEHVIDASAPGHAPWHGSVDVAAGGDRKSVTVPALVDAPEAATAATPTPGTVNAPPASPAGLGSSGGGAAPSPTYAASTEARGPSLTLAWVSGGIGVAALGVGAGFGLHALAKKHDSDRLCPTDSTCAPGGADANANAMQSADIATAAFAVGLVGVGVATVLFLMHGHSAETARSARVPPPPSGPLRITGYDLGAGDGQGFVSVRGAF